MLDVLVSERLYKIEFQHCTKDAAQRHTLCTVTICETNPECPIHGSNTAALEWKCACSQIITTVVAKARCNPVDGYKKETGRKLALGRALFEAEPNKQFRQLCWDAYFTRSRAGGKEIDAEIGLVED